MRDQLTSAAGILDEMYGTPAGAPAPPTTPAPNIMRDGRVLVVAHKSVLPSRCIKCDAPADRRRYRRRFYWHHPALYLIILAGLLIYVIVALIVRQSIEVDFALCERHRRIRARTIAWCWLISLGGIATIVASIAFESGIAVLVGVAMFFGGLVFAAIALPMLRPVHIDRGVGRFKGCCQAFLSHLPPAPRWHR